MIYTREDFKQAVDWLDTGEIPFEKIISHTFPLDQAQKAMDLVAQRQEDFMKVLVKV